MIAAAPSRSEDLSSVRFRMPNHSRATEFSAAFTHQDVCAEVRHPAPRSKTVTKSRSNMWGLVVLANEQRPMARFAECRLFRLAEHQQKLAEPRDAHGEIYDVAEVFAQKFGKTMRGGREKVDE